MWRHPLILGILVLSVMTGMAGGVYSIAERQSKERLAEEGKTALEAGNYLASLVSFNQLKKETPENPEISAGAARSQELLVADALLSRARSAAAEGDWLAVRALLGSSETITDTSFKGYDEALTLLANATAKVSILEEKITEELDRLRREAAEEKAVRQEVEVKKKQIETTLQTTIEEKEQREAALKEKVSESESEAKTAKEAAEKERAAKFSNELAVYVGLVENGTKDLDAAVAEAEAGRDTSALIYINQGSAFFDEVKIKAEDLLKNRTPVGEEERVRNLLKATALLVLASRSFGNMVLYIGEEGKDFEMHKVAGQTAEADARTLIKDLRIFVSSH